MFSLIHGRLVRSVSRSVSCQLLQCAVGLVRHVEQSTFSLLTLKNDGGWVVTFQLVLSIVRECELLTISIRQVEKVVSGEWERMLVPTFMSVDYFVPYYVYIPMSQAYISVRATVSTITYLHVLFRALSHSIQLKYCVVDI